jgi:DedD protein
MARSTSEEEIRLRKRARRRLIGAIALTTLVVVTLPMVLDSEPRPIGDDIAVQIPSPNSGPYAPKGQVDAPRAAVPATASGIVGSPPASAPAPADMPPAAAAAAAPAPVRPVAPASATPADQKIEVAGALRPPSDAGAAAAAATADARNAAEAAAAARASAARVAEAKAAEAKAAEAKAAEAVAAESKAAAAARAPAEAKPAPAKAAEARAAEAKAGEATAATVDADAKSFVIQLGAFSEANRARDRHAQLVNAGVKGYTEVIKTPTGDKTRVRAGPFPNRDAAEKANERLKTLGMTDGIVVPRRY